MECPPPPAPPIGSEVVLLPFTGALWGATCVQTFTYFVHHSSKDNNLHRILVIWLWLADTTHLILTLLGIYQLTVAHFGDLSQINSISQQFLWSLFFTTVVSCPVQLYFTYRIWILSRRKLMFLIIFIPLAIAQPAIYTAFLVICYGNITTSKTLYAIKELLITVWTLSAAVDISIAASLLYYIWKLKLANVAGFQSTNKLLDRAAILTVNTGVWTAICSLFTIITITAFPASPAFTAVAFLICPLYCNTFLANLNSRGFVGGSSLEDSEKSRFGSLGFVKSDNGSTSRDAIDLPLGPISNEHTRSNSFVASNIEDNELKSNLDV